MRLKPSTYGANFLKSASPNKDLDKGHAQSMGVLIKHTVISLPCHKEVHHLKPDLLKIHAGIWLDMLMLQM